MEQTESVRSELQTIKEHLETAKASCADLSSANEKLTSDKTQLHSQVELHLQNIAVLQKRTPQPAFRYLEPMLADATDRRALDTSSGLDEKTADYNSKSQEAEAGAAKVTELETALTTANSELENMKKSETQLEDELTSNNKELAARLDEVVSFL